MRRVMGQQISKRIWGAVSTILLAVSAVFVLIPFAWMLVTSLQPDLKSVLQIPPNWIPDPLTWRNYLTAWNSAPFDVYLKNSIIVAISATILQVINACLSGYVFSWIKFPGRDFIFLLFLAVLMVPGQVTVIPSYIVMSRLKWLDTYWALIIPLSATAFGTFLIRQAFLTIPEDLVDAAIVDGATHLQILKNVMIPLNKPMILTFALLSFNWRWNNYFWVLIMTNSTAMRTLPVGLVGMRMGPEGASQWQIIMAATVMVIIPIMLIFIFFQRYFVEGVARSGLKG
jgi:ABC-type glycerol-3-phosphate transport system permease component